MADTIDLFLKTRAARKNNILSRTDFLTRVSSSWLKYFDKEYDLFNKEEDKSLRDKQLLAMLDNIYKKP